MLRRPMIRDTAWVAVASAALLVTAVVPAGSAGAGTRFPVDGHEHYGTILNILPPGSTGNVTSADLAALGAGNATGGATSIASLLSGLANPQAFFATATPTTPTNFANQLEMYDALNRANPLRLTNAALTKYFKDAPLGVDPRDVVRTETPKAGVTIKWDRWGVPHIFGQTYNDVAYGSGVADMEDRMFLTDVLRHAGEATLAQFVGPTDPYVAQDAEQLQVAPYTSKQVDAMIRDITARYPGYGKKYLGALDSMIAGMNAEQKTLCPAATPTVPLPNGLGFGYGQNCPVEYAALQRPPAPYSRTDVVALASLVAGILGTGGGGQYTNAIWLQQLWAKFGRKQGTRIYNDLREKNDPEAPVTSPVTARYGTQGGVHPFRPGVALPDLHPKATALATGAIVNSDGSLSPPPSGGPGSMGNASTSPPKPTPKAMRGNRMLRYAVQNEAGGIVTSLQRAMAGQMVGMSNELIVDGKHSAGGHPIAVFGPQTGYYAPQLLMEEDLEGPGVAARGVAFAGTNFLVELGHGVDYAWSATSPYTDITDIVVQRLCNVGGGKPTVKSTAYVAENGRCTPMTDYRHTETGLPTLAAQASPKQIKFLVLETDHGVVELRTTVHGKPVAIVADRSTYLHDVASVVGFGQLDDPNYVHGPVGFEHAVSHIDYTFNWYYIDAKHIAYYSSARLPIRSPKTDLDLPRWAGKRFDWRGFEPFGKHPHVIDPKRGYIVNWNNKLAPHFDSASEVWGDGSVYRSRTLIDRVTRLMAHGKVTRAALTGAMIDAGTVDVRGRYVLPFVLDVIGKPRNRQDAAAVRLLRSWVRAGAHRVDRARTGHYAHQAAIDLFDTWWNTLPLDAMRGGLGADVNALPEPLDDPPSENIGSAYNGISWYGYLNKDLRTLLHRHVRGKFSRLYCGGGSLRRCRAQLRASLHEAVLAAKATEKVSSVTQLTYDKARDDIVSSAAGVVGVRKIDWQNRPTFQQVVQFFRHR